MKSQKITETHRYKYDDKGNLIEFEKFFTPDPITKKNQQITHQYKYDDKGHLFEEVEFNSNFKYITKYNEKGDETEYDVYQSDSAKRQKSLSSENTTDKFTNLYNKKGQLTEVIHPSDKIKHKYDKKGNRTEDDYYGPTGRIVSTIVYKFDKRGNRIAVIGHQYERNGMPNYKILFKYDEHNNNNNTEEYYSNIDGTFLSKTTTQYEYDQTSNWIKEMVIRSDGKQRTTTRTIEYY